MSEAIDERVANAVEPVAAPVNLLQVATENLFRGRRVILLRPNPEVDDVRKRAVGPERDDFVVQVVVADVDMRRHNRRFVRDLPTFERPDFPVANRSLFAQNDDRRQQAVFLLRAPGGVVLEFAPERTL